MSAPAPATAAPVIGDGTTGRSRAISRWRRARWPLALVAIVLVVGLLAALPSPRTSTAALAPDNASANGARALAEVLREQGVEIDYVRTSAAAVELAARGTTLLVTNDTYLTDDQLEQVAGTEADLVLVDPVFALPLATSAAETAPGYEPEQVREALCGDPDALAAGTLLSGGSGFVALDGQATVCFPATGDASGAGAYLVVEGERRVTAFANGSVLTNASVTAEGNAALALRALGRNDHLVWYVPSLNDSGEAASPPLGDLLPPWARALGLQLLLVAAVAGVWRARRLGRVVVEPLPVTVRSGEATRGRGRLYRRSRSYGHAAAALRAGVATRTSAQLGLPRSAPAPAVIDALARATGRTPDDVAALLYGPPPTEDNGLALLARTLDELESEVHRT